MKNLFLKTVLLLGLNSLSSHAIYANYYENCSPFNGFYVGVSGGIATNFADLKLNSSAEFDTADGNTTVLGILDQQNSNFSPYGEIFIGKGWQCRCFYLGGRIGINFSNFEPRFSLNTAILDPEDEGNIFADSIFKTRLWTAEYTFDFKPGYVFCQRTLLFGILGAAINKKNIQGHFSFRKTAGDFISTTAAVDFSTEKSRVTSGLRAGLGLEYLINSCISLQVCYTYTHYWSLSEAVSGSITDSGGTTTPTSASISTVLRKQVTSVGLAYYF